MLHRYRFSQKNQRGRSLLEIIAVIVIIILLTFGGLWMYQYAMGNYAANMVYGDLLAQAEALRNRGGATNKTIYDSSVGGQSRTGRRMAFCPDENNNSTTPCPSFDDKTFDVVIFDVMAEACQALAQKDWPMDRVARVKIGDQWYDPRSIECGVEDSFDLRVTLWTNSVNAVERQSILASLCSGDDDCLSCQKCQNGICKNNCSGTSFCKKTDSNPNGECLDCPAPEETYCDQPIPEDEKGCPTKEYKECYSDEVCINHECEQCATAYSLAIGDHCHKDCPNECGVDLWCPRGLCERNPDAGPDCSLYPNSSMAGLPNQQIGTTGCYCTGSYFVSGNACALISCASYTGTSTTGTGGVAGLANDGQTDCKCPSGKLWGTNSCVCPSNQYLNGSTCTNCPTNATCNGQTFTCEQNYFVSGNACVAISCASYTGTSTTGTGGVAGKANDGQTDCKCPSGKNWTGSSCTTDCSLYPNSSTTVREGQQIGTTGCYCNPGYEVDGNTCKAVVCTSTITTSIENCKTQTTCTNPSGTFYTCTECKTGYKLSENGDECVAACSTSYPNSSTTVREGQQIGTTGCYCDLGYEVEDNTCKAVVCTSTVTTSIENCQTQTTCTSPSGTFYTCTECETGYTLSETGDECVADCSTYPNSSTTVREGQQIGTTGCYCDPGYEVEGNTCKEVVCTTNNECGTGSYCDITDFISYHGARSDFSSSNYIRANGGKCQPIGGYTDVSVPYLGSLRRSHHKMDWYSAKNWCTKQNKNLISVDALSCYQSGKGTQAKPGNTVNSCCDFGQICMCKTLACTSVEADDNNHVYSSDPNRYSYYALQISSAFNDSSFISYWLDSPMGNKNNDSYMVYVLDYVVGSFLYPSLKGNSRHAENWHYALCK